SLAAEDRGARGTGGGSRKSALRGAIISHGPLTIGPSEARSRADPMTTVPTKTITDALHWRYATKKFDPAKRIPAATWEALEQALVLSPSSFGLQPWKFIIVQ